METINISRNELKKIIRETFLDVLNERKDIIGNAVVEAIEDFGLAGAIIKERTGEYIGTESFKKKLESRIKRAK
jgi:hypothetical protein